MNPNDKPAGKGTLVLIAAFTALMYAVAYFCVYVLPYLPKTYPSGY